MKTESVTAAYKKPWAVFTPRHSAKVKHVQLHSLRSVAGPQLLSCLIVLYVCVCMCIRSSSAQAFFSPQAGGLV